MPSLYANLLNPEAAEKATISGAPVKYEFTRKQDEASAREEKKSDAALRFQPVRRPQTSSNKPTRKGQPAGLKRPPPPTAKVADTASAAADDKPASGIEKWKNGNEDEEDPYAAEYLRHKEEEKQRQRWANKKRKKKAQDSGRWVDFEQIYDPQQPTRLEDYRGSDEQASAEHEWKQLLHAHQVKKPTAATLEPPVQETKSFAPPRGYNFAPPPAFDDGSAPTMVRPPQSPPQARSPLQRPVADDGDDPYTQRMRMSRSQFVQVQADQIDSSANRRISSSPPPPGERSTFSTRLGTLSAEPVRYVRVDQDPEDEPTRVGLGLGHADMHPRDEQDDDRADPEQVSHAADQQQQQQQQHVRSTRPGQKDFAKRLLLKYGWTAGQGLGAQGDGITTALRHVTSKSAKSGKRKAGAAAGVSGPGATGVELAGQGIGRIVGGKRRRQNGDCGGEGTDADGDLEWSIVARFEGMLAGIDVSAALEQGELMQTIGDRMAEFGVVERLLFDRESDADGSASGVGGSEAAAAGTAAGTGTGTGTGAAAAAGTTALKATTAASDGKTTSGPNVLVKFTSALSAYRAIQAGQAKDFLGNGRITTARFWNADKFEAGVYS